MSGRLPPWFKQKLPDPQVMGRMAALVDESSLHTICESALCPNAGECFTRKTATFLILGDTCTRRCTFCAVNKGIASPVDPEEPRRVADAARSLGLKYAVITSVTRDDLPDGGASQFVSVVKELHTAGIQAEVLVPDFRGSEESLKAVVDSRPEVINHNVETVPRLYSEVRPGADYRRSLSLLAQAKELRPEMITKSGLMVGLGETEAEIRQVMKDLRQAGCDVLTIGQYLQPTPHHHPVVEFLTPDEFAGYARTAKELGFAALASAPLVRSSYHAEEMYGEALSRYPVDDHPHPNPLPSRERGLESERQPDLPVRPALLDHDSPSREN